MRNISKIALAALIISAASCDKNNTTTTPANNNNNNNNTTTTPTATYPTPSGSDISGALISIKMKYNTSVTGSPVPISLESQIGAAVFYSAPGSSTMVDAGAVSVNTVSLDKNASNNSYSKMGTMGLTPATLDFDKGSNWNVGGSSSVTAFTYNHTTTFPEYTGTLPSTVTKASGITLSLSSEVSNADSVYVLVAAGNTSVLKAFAASATNIVIKASDLVGLPNVSDNTAIMEVCPFRYVMTTQNGKKYVAIKEQAVVQNVNIN